MHDVRTPVLREKGGGFVLFKSFCARVRAAVGCGAAVRVGGRVVDEQGVDGGDLRERGLQFGASDLFAVDLEVLEERLVEEPALGGVRLKVGSLDVVGELERQVKCARDVLLVDLVAGEQVVGCSAFTADAQLLFLEDVAADRVGVVGVEKLALLVVEPGDLGLRSLGLLGGDAGDTVDVGLDGVADALALKVVELDRGVVALDGGFDGVSAVVGLLAETCSSAAADEVVVEAAVSAACLGEEEATSAFGAVEGATQVVVVDPGALAGLTLGCEDLLHLLEGCIVDDRLVAAAVGAAGVGDDSDVVGVAKHTREPVGAEHLRRLLVRRARAQSSCFEDCGKVGEGVVAGGVEVEGELDQWCALGVDLDGADLAAVDPLARIEVADRGLEGCASGLRLLRGAFHDLGGQVLAIELRDRAHDPEQESSARGFVDVFGRADELGAGGPDAHHNVDLVGPASREPIDLVDDDVRDVLVEESLQERLEGRAIRGLGGLAAVDELVDNHRAERFGFASTGFALGGDAEAFGVVVLVGLLAA